MSKKRKVQKRTATPASKIGFLISDTDSICVSGYTPLDHNPEIMTACRTIAELIGSITIHLMSNTNKGDIRIINELSRVIDISPMPTMTRSSWMQAIIMNLLLYGGGNSIVWPHTQDGYLGSLEPIAASRVSLMPVGGSYREYKILVDGVAHDPSEMLHFVHNPDKFYLWKGRGLQVSLRDIATNLKQASATEKGFMESKWKPSLIVKVDAMTEEFSSREGREKLRADYLESGEAGAPWIIPAEQFEVQEVRPLSLSDLAISDVVQLDKKAVAAIIGVPAFVLGVGQFNKDEWNNFIQNKIRTMCLCIAQELTKKLILSPKWYFKFNTLSLMNWDLQTIANVFGSLSDRGFVNGNEVRDQIGFSPVDGLDEYRVLENYIPFDMAGMQKKLLQGGSNE